MKKRKQMITVGIILVALLGIGCWYLFMGSRIIDGSSEIMAGEDGTRSLMVYFSRTGEIPGTVCTSSDNGIDVSMDYIREAAEGATVLEGYRVHNYSMEDVAGWLERIGMLNQTDGTDAADSEQTEPEETTNITRAESSLGSVTEGTEEYSGFVIDNVVHSVSEGGD